MNNNDIVGFLKKGDFHSFVLSSWGWPKYIRARLLVVAGFLDKYFTLTETLHLMLPARYKGIALKAKFLSFINKEDRNILKEFIDGDGALNVFENKFIRRLTIQLKPLV